MKNDYSVIKRVLSISIVIATFLTMQGIVILAADIKNDIIGNEYSSYNGIDENVVEYNYEEDEIDLSTPLNPFIEIYEKIIEEIRSGRLAPVTNETRLSELENRAEREIRTRDLTVQDLNYNEYVRDYTNKYVIEKGSETIDLSTLSVGREFSVGKIVGRNGIGTELLIRYDLDESSSFAPHFIKSENVKYSVKRTSILIDLTNETVCYLETEINTYSTYNAAYNDASHQNSGVYEYSENGIDYCFIQGQLMSFDSYYEYELYYDQKDIHLTNMQLSDGWRFNIPYIEIQVCGGNNLSYYQVLHLDNGMSVNMQDYIVTQRPLEDIMVTTGTFATSAGTATVKAVLLNGTTYYFNSINDCIRKEDRYGNGINYIYNPQEGYISEIIADTGAKIVFAFTNSSITITSPDGGVVTIGIIVDTDDNREVTSIDYGANEIYTFEYAKSGYNIFDGNNIIDIVEYNKLTKLTEPSGAYCQYIYSTVSAGWGTYKRHYPVLQSKSVKENNETKYLTTYGATGTAFDTQSFESMNVDDYTYTISVTEGVKASYYTFNINNLCTKQIFSDETVTKTYNEYYLPTTVTKKVGSMIAAESYTYDSRGNVLTYTNPQGNVTTCTYSQLYGLLLSKTFGNLRVESTLSQDNKAISKVEKYWNNTLVNRTDFTYDTYGNVLTETEYIYPGTNTRTITYSYTDNVTRSQGIDYSGMFVTSKTITGVKDADNQTVGTITYSNSYDLLGRVLSSTDAENNTTTYTYNTKGQLTTVTYPNNSTENYNYDSANERVTYTDRNGYALTTQYDYLGNVLTVKENSTNYVLQTNTYDLYGRTATSANYGSQSVTEYTYDIKDRVTSQKIKNSQGTVQYQENYSYSVVGTGGAYYLKTVKTILGDTNSPSIVTSEYVNKMGQKARSGEFIGETEVLTINTYDIYGNVLSVSRNGRTVSYTYDYNGKVLTETNALNNTTTYTYDNQGNVLTATDPLNGQVTNTYDILGRKIKTTTILQTGVTNITKEYYNKNNQNTETKVTDSNATVFLRTQNTYDGMGNVTAVTQYDGNNTITKSLTYNNAGKVLTETINGKTTTNTYDFRGNLSSVTDAMNHVETYVIDSNGLLTIKTDRNGTVFAYTYDSLGRVLTETAMKNNLSQTKTYTYTKTGLLRSTNNNGVVVTNTYDNFGRLTIQNESDGITHRYFYNNNNERIEYKLIINGETELWEKYTYNAAGQMLTTNEVKKTEIQVSTINQSGHQSNSVLSSDGIVLGTYSIVNSNGDILVYDSTSTIVMNIKFTGINVCGEIYLDSLGNVDSGYVIYSGEEYDFGNISYYDPEEMLGQGVSVIYYITNASGTITDTIMADVPLTPMPGEGIISWVYEGFLCPTESEVEYVEQSPFVTYTYDARGNVTKEEYKNGTETIYTYYSSGLPHTIVNKKGNTTLSSFSYTYYPDGNIASVTEIGKVTYYGYDGYGRLTEERTVANNNIKMVSYTYDNNGNRTSKTENGILTSYTYDNNNRITTELTGTILTYYSYDNNGNLLSSLAGGNYTGTYTYDLFNREKSFTPNYIGYTYYTYRADGLRHSIGSTTHCWDETNIVCDIDGTDYTLYFRAISLVVYRENKTDKYYLKNIQGDTVQLTNASGVVAKSYKYNGYGDEKDKDPSDNNPFRYRGEYYDKVTGTIYLRARSYSASRGVFTTEDPIRDGNNWFGYCTGNPVNIIDPTGCISRDTVLAILDSDSGPEGNFNPLKRKPYKDNMDVINGIVHFCFGFSFEAVIDEIDLSFFKYNHAFSKTIMIEYTDSEEFFNVSSDLSSHSFSVSLRNLKDDEEIGINFYMDGIGIETRFGDYSFELKKGVDFYDFSFNYFLSNGWRDSHTFTISENDLNKRIDCLKWQSKQKETVPLTLPKPISEPSIVDKVVIIGAASLVVGFVIGACAKMKPSMAIKEGLNPLKILFN